MPLSNAKPMTWQIKGVSDAIDGSNAFKGAMRAMRNLVPSPATLEHWVPRPARDYLLDMVAAGVWTSPGVVSNLIVFGGHAYGFVASLRNPGRDEPFVVDATTGQPVTVAGITRDDSPTTAPPQGATQYPLFAVVGAYVVATHPGFPGGLFNPTTTPAFATVITANTIAGSAQLSGLFSGQLYPGLLLTDTLGALAANTYLLSTGTTDFNHLATGLTGNNFFTVDDATGIAIGQLVAGPGVSGQVSLLGGPGGTTVTITGVLTQDLSAAVVSFHGNTVTMSLPALGTSNNNTVTASVVGDRTIKFGWWDLTGLNAMLQGTTTSGQPTVAVANIVGLSAGQMVSGTGIPSGARIKTLQNPTYTGVAGTIDPNNSTLLNLTINYPSGTPTPLPIPAVGAAVTGPGILSGTTVTAAVWQQIGSTASILVVGLSHGAQGTAPISGLYTIAGLYNIVLDTNATASGTVTITVTGGTAAAPLWCAGDTAINNLPSTPLGVGVFNGRAEFACGKDGVPFSDIFNPGQRTYANQAVIPGNQEPVTACVGQPLQSPITGGMTSALYLFQGTNAIQQLTGDPTTGNLALQALNIATGTAAPAAIVPTTLGMAFISPEGLRLIDFSGTISQPIGEGGQGVTLPLISAADPTRIVANANGDVIRVALDDTLQIGTPRVEYWYDLARKVWSGPHTIATGAMDNYGNTFITSATDHPARLYKSPSLMTGFSDHEEDGATITWMARTVLLPDTEEMAQNAINEATLGLLLPSDMAVTVEAFDESGASLDAVVVPGAYTMPKWGGPNLWGTGLWYSVVGFFRQERLHWHRELNFKQIYFEISGTARFGTAVGALRLKYQRLGYLMQPYPYVAVDISVPPLTGAPVINGYPQSLIVSNYATPLTVIGAVLAQATHYGDGLQASLKLVYNQLNRLVLVPFSDDNVAGNTTAGSAMVTGLTPNALTEGLVPGLLIGDSVGAIAPGTFILSIDPSGVILTLSQPALRSVTGVLLLVEGTVLATNWPQPIPAGTVTGEIQAIVPDYLTSYFPFILTVFSGGPAVAADAGAGLTTDQGAPIMGLP